MLSRNDMFVGVALAQLPSMGLVSGLLFRGPGLQF
jgi:hypothetical protein